MPAWHPRRHHTAHAANAAAASLDICHRRRRHRRHRRRRRRRFYLAWLAVTIETKSPLSITGFELTDQYDLDFRASMLTMAAIASMCTIFCACVYLHGKQLELELTFCT
jgi:hypothetical protein